MKSNINDSPLKPYSDVPPSWSGKPNVLNYDKSTGSHYADGWRDIIVPPYDSLSRDLGDLIKVGDTVTYEVVELSETEIINATKQNYSSEKQKKIEKKIEDDVVVSLRLSSDAVAIENKEVFPFWSADMDLPIVVGDKWNDFVGTEPKLYKCVQAHTSQFDRRPSVTPALFTLISLEEWPVWIQPTGAQDAWNSDVSGRGNKVTHNGQKWQTTVLNNIWEPGVYGWINSIA